MDSLIYSPGFPVHGGSGERQWDARELEMGRGTAGLPKDKAGNTQGNAAQREGMGRAVEQG